MTRPGTVVVTGASRGIGRAIAAEYAGPGTHLVLVGRDRTRLDETAGLCRAKGAAADVLPLDIRDRAAVAAALLAADGRRPVDLLVANAGVAAPTGDDATAEASSFEEIAVNLSGALNTVWPLVPAMSARGRGQIALVSSLAAFAPLPDSPGYSASKAGLLAFGLALRGRLRPRGVRVNVACPGYVDTAMGERYGGWRPLAMSAERAAARIAAGLARDRALIAFPFPLAAAARLSTMVPEPIMRLGMAAFRFRIDRRG